MGAYHDFIEFPNIAARYDSIGNTCTDVGGIMDYGLFVEKWTQCSREDFEFYFRYIRSEDSGFFSFCALVFSVLIHLHNLMLYILPLSST